MAITLTPVPSPLVTPIGYNIDSAKKFDADYAIVGVPTLTDQQRRTIRILGLIYLLSKLTPVAVNYKTNHKGLVQDAMVYTGNIPMFDLTVAQTVTDWDAGKTADSTLSSDVATLLQEGRGLLQFPVETQDRIIAFLRVQLGN